MTAARGDPGLFESLKRVSGGALGMLQSRLALAALELGEARERLLVTALMAFAAVLLGCAALVALSVWLAFALWDRSGPVVVLFIAAGYALGAALLLWRLRARVRSAPPLLADTLAELRRDAQALRRSGDRNRDPSQP